MWKLFGLSPLDKAQSKPSASRTLPASWYSSAAMFQLDRRAIFSRKWILVTHSLRFKEAGDYMSFTYAKISFFLVLDKSGTINAFHNLCRHRAYPIVHSPCGRASIFSCKYHGWSYGLGGNLAKAPRFDTVQGFDKRQHGLLPVHVHTDKAGFVWINLDAGKPESWDKAFRGADETERIKTFDFAADYVYDHTWTLDINANWKSLIDNYNECYHCPTSHPLIAAVTDLTRYTVEPRSEALEHTIVNREAEQDGRFRRSITFFFPSTSVTATSDFFYIQRMVPVTESTSRIENEVYRHKDAKDEDFAAINAFFRQVLDEDKQLCEGAQQNLQNGIYITGELHPDKEKGPINFQSIVRREVTAHRRKEEAGGAEIWPAVPEPQGGMKTCELVEEQDFCSKLEAASCTFRDELAW